MTPNMTEVLTLAKRADDLEHDIKQKQWELRHLQHELLFALVVNERLDMLQINKLAIRRYMRHNQE